MSKKGDLMKYFKNLFVCSLCFILSFSLLGIPAYADDSSSTEYPSQEQIQDELTTREAGVSVVGDDEATEALDKSIRQGKDGSTDGEAGREDFDLVCVSAADAVEFVFLEESVVALGEEQSIAFGLTDNTACIESAQLDLIRLDSNKKIELEAAKFVEGAAVFSTTFENEMDVAAYQLTGIRYEFGEASYYADLTDIEDGVAYTFDVVAQSVSEAFKKSSEISEVGDVSAFAVKDDGSLVATDSVESAVEVADTEGATDVSTEEADSDTADGVMGFSTNAQKEARAQIPTSRENYLFVAIDPGHGGSDGGAVGYGLKEKDVNLSIAWHCYNELSTYTGVTPYLTRTGDEYVGLQERVNRAVVNGADVFVSVHCNSSGDGRAAGSEVWVPNNSSYNYSVHQDGYDLGSRIQRKLVSLGLSDRSVKTRPSERVDGEGPYYNPDGSIQDYYTVIQSSREAGIPGIIVEHAFINNAEDASKLGQDSFRQQLGVADAAGVAEKYSLVKDSIAQSQSLVQAKGHSEAYGWLGNVYDQKVVGTTKKAMGLQAFQASLKNAAASIGGITYRSYVGNGWQNWVSDGATSGTTGQATALQAIEMKLTGVAASKYDVYYRVHVAGEGWLDWAKNGQSAGSLGFNYNAEAIEISLVNKGTAAPGDTKNPLKVKSETVSYQAHVSSIGWQGAASSGGIAGTVGQALAVEAVRMSIANQETSGSIRYNLHCSDIGWQGWATNGSTGGTTGEARQTEAIQVQLTGNLASVYDIYYRVHTASFGWLNWAKNGETAGTEGYGYSMQALQVELVKKGEAAPGPVSNHNYKALIRYDAHIAADGWQSPGFDGSVVGTTGRSLAVEALTVNLRNQAYSGGVEYQMHCADVGWQGWRAGGYIAGTVGEARQTEALQMRLTGEMKERYDIYYRVHAQGFGWLSWASNGTSAGTAGYRYRMEAVQIVLVEKGGFAPGDTSKPFEEKVTVSSSAIMGMSKASVVQMVASYNSTGYTYPSNVYATKGAADITQFCSILFEEAAAEGVRAEVLFCQAMKESGWLRFGGSVDPQQCNFGGLGATSPTVGGAVFPDVRTGLRAQAQHLKAYASTAKLNNPCVDPRFELVTRGIAPNLEDLNGRWAVPGNNYGQGILAMVNALLKY